MCFVVLVQTKSFEEPSFRLTLSQCRTGRRHGRAPDLSAGRGRGWQTVETQKIDQLAAVQSYVCQLGYGKCRVQSIV